MKQRNSYIQDIKKLSQLKVSIIVLSYNQDLYIRKTIDSILMQEVDFDYEILIGDDHSTDCTLKIIEEYSLKYPHNIKFYCNEKNIGPSMNAYNMLTRARGEYIATCEGDDYWIDSRKLQTQVDFLDLHEDFVGCTHRFEVIDEKDTLYNIHKLSWIRYRRRFQKKHFKGYLMPGQPSTYLRRNIYLLNNYDFSIIYKAHTMIADRTTMLLYLSYGDFYCFSDIMSRYRIIRYKKKNNVTFIAYDDNEDSILHELKFTELLEDFAKEELCLDISFFGIRKKLFLDSIFQNIKGLMSGKDIKKYDIFQSYNCPVRFYLFLPLNIIGRILSFCFRKISSKAY